MQKHCYRCGKRHTRLRSCRYCDEYFCDEHLPVKMCLTPSLLNDKKLPYWIRVELEKEWRKGGHPDAEYTSMRWKEFDKKEKLHDKSLSDLLSKPTKQERPHIMPELRPEEPIGKPYESLSSNKKTHFKLPSNKLIIFLIIVAAVTYFVFLAPQETKNNLSEYLERMKNNISPLFEKAKNNITQAISSTGISEWVNKELSLSPEQKNETKKAFDYINQIRKQNNRNPLQWDDRLYELAVNRSKDMYERNYFDHTSPDGKCVKDFQSFFELNGYTIAENLGAQYIGYNDYDMKFDKTIDVKEQVDGWMQSRGHRYNLMYPDHIEGAIGCYYGVCAFLGANTDPYGLGAGPCTTGEQGLAYWKSVGKQPGEVG